MNNDASRFSRAGSASLVEAPAAPDAGPPLFGGPASIIDSDRRRLSAGAPWQDILSVEQYRVSTLAPSESCPREHVIGMWLGTPGKVEWRIAGGRRQSTTMASQGLWLLTKGTRIWWRQTRETDVLLAALAPTFITAVAGRLARQDRVEFDNLVAFRDSAIEHTMLTLRAELLQGCPTGRLFGEALATALAVRLMRLCAVAAPAAARRRSGLAPARLRRVLDYIEGHISGDTSLPRLARLVQMSPRHFAWLFKQSTGQSPHRYVIERRIAASRPMLAHTTRPMAEIAYGLGFSSQAHFTTAFRRLVGVTPKSFRQAHEHP